MKGIPVRWVVFVWILGAVGAGPVESSGAPAAAGVVLKPELIVGSEYVTETTSEMTMKLPTSDVAGDQRVEMEEQHRISISDSGDGQKLVEFEVTAVRVDMRMPGMAVRYDSRDPVTRDAPLGEPFRKLIDKPVQVVYDGDDQFVKMADTDAFSGSGNSPFGVEIGQDQMKQMINPSFVEGIPEEAVGPGDSWTYTMAVPVAAMGEMDFDLKFVYTKDAEIEGHACALIDVSGTMRAQAAGDPGEGQAESDEALERRADEGFESSKLSGTIAVDKNVRVIRESDMTMEMILKMPSPLGGEEDILVPVKAAHALDRAVVSPARGMKRERQVSLDFSKRGIVIGVVHLRPLPGSAGWGGAMDAVEEAALDDAAAYEAGGCDAVFLENFGDLPFTGGAVGCETVAGMAAVARRVRERIGIPMGFNVLRNDASAALGLCAACGGDFIRVNVHTGAMMTDQGIIEGEAHETVRRREALCPGVKILADILVKHASPLTALPIEQVAIDTLQRGRADAIIVSGTATGAAAEMDDLRRVREACPEAPLFVGSGANEENALGLLEYASGLIVGTSLKREGVLGNAVDVERVRRLVGEAASAR